MRTKKLLLLLAPHDYFVYVALKSKVTNGCNGILQYITKPNLCNKRINLLKLKTLCNILKINIKVMLKQIIEPLLSVTDAVKILYMPLHFYF